MKTPYITSTLFRGDAAQLKDALEKLLEHKEGDHEGVAQMLLNRVASQAIQMSMAMEHKRYG